MASYQGFLQEQLERTSYGWNSGLIIIIIGFLYFTGAKFLRTFLNVRFYSKWIDNVLLALQWMGFGFIPMNFFPNPITPLYGFILVGAGPIFSTTISVVLWVRGVPNAKYFALGWIVGHLTSELDLLRVFGAIPWIPAMSYLIPAALFSSIIFFSIAIVEQSKEYRYFANRDGLTGLANRRYFDEVLNREWNRNMRNLKPLSIIMADVDSFKAYNDTYGHKSGDECLAAIGRTLTQNVKRAGDMAARYGGEEFVVLLTETYGEEAALLSEKIRSAIEGLKIPHASSRVKKYVTISLGVASAVPNQELKPSDLIKQADTALYKAKREGRNKVVSDETLPKTSR
jgi:diguanylate cyclase (GGDEF)-like protein